MGATPKARFRAPSFAGLLGAPASGVAGAPSRKAAAAQRRRGAFARHALLWLATGIAVVGILRLESMYKMTRLSAWVPQTTSTMPSAHLDGAATDAASAAAGATTGTWAAAPQRKTQPPQQRRPRRPVPPTALMLATHSRLMWYDPATGDSATLHEGGGVHYGMFPGGDGSVWTAVRPHNWRPTEAKEYLVEIDMATGERGTGGWGEEGVGEGTG